MGAVIQLHPPLTQDEAFKRYTDLVDRRATENLWKDLELNKQIALAWDEWADLFLGSERKP